MIRKIFLPINDRDRETVNRYGFNPAVALLIADEIGGLWQVGEDGDGRELVAPFRCCRVENYERHAAYYSQNQGFSGQSFCFQVFKAEEASTLEWRFVRR